QRLVSTICLMPGRPPTSTRFPYTTLFRSPPHGVSEIFAAAPPELTRSISLQNTLQLVRIVVEVVEAYSDQLAAPGGERDLREAVDRKSTRLNSSHVKISYAVFCLKKKKET